MEAKVKGLRADGTEMKLIRKLVYSNRLYVASLLLDHIVKTDLISHWELIAFPAWHYKIGHINMPFREY